MNFNTARTLRTSKPAVNDDITDICHVTKHMWVPKAPLRTP